jgi:Flagellar hook capping protein - N-terminal region
VAGNRVERTDERRRGRGHDEFGGKFLSGRKVERARVAALGKDSMVILPVIPKPVDAMNPSTTGTSPSGGTNDNLGLGGTQLNTQDFISILTAQLQYQDPLNPLDPNQFVGEMAQFSSLNELIGIKQDLDQNLQNAQASPTAIAGSPARQPTTGISQ